jgi:hypothetical protein
MTRDPKEDEFVEKTKNFEKLKIQEGLKLK